MPCKDCAGGDPPDRDEHDCGRPCDPDLNNECCADYWARMVREGYWNAERHEWTPSGIRERSSYE